jgi:hypothetical protein
VWKFIIILDFLSNKCSLSIKAQMRLLLSDVVLGYCVKFEIFSSLVFNSLCGYVQLSVESGEPEEEAELAELALLLPAVPVLRPRALADVNDTAPVCISVVHYRCDC